MQDNGPFFYGLLELHRFSVIIAENYVCQRLIVHQICELFTDVIKTTAANELLAKNYILCLTCLHVVVWSLFYICRIANYTTFYIGLLEKNLFHDDLGKTLCIVIEYRSSSLPLSLNFELNTYISRRIIAVCICRAFCFNAYQFDLFIMFIVGT